MQNDMVYKFSGLARTAINLNKLEAFKLIYNKLIQTENEDYIF